MSFASRAIYLTHKVLISVRSAPGLSLLTAGTITAALLLIGLYAMALQNLEYIALVWGRAASVSAYLVDGTDRETREVLRRELLELEAVERAEVVTPEQALERFAERGKEAAALVAGVDPGILPASIELHLKSDFADIATVQRMAADLAENEAVSSVDYGQNELQSLRRLLDVLRLGGVLGGLLFAVATSLIVSNTIRLTVYARRDEIAIERLVGATKAFVRTPFLLEGSLWGLLGAAFAVALLFFADLVAAPRISQAVSHILGGLQVRLFCAEVAVALVLFGVLVGATASGLAVRRFFDTEES